MRLLVTVTLPEELGPSFMQHLRDFDIHHKDKCHFDIVTNAPGMSVQQFRKMTDLNPELPFQEIINIAKGQRHE